MCLEKNCKFSFFFFSAVGKRNRWVKISLCACLEMLPAFSAEKDLTFFLMYTHT